MDFGKWGDGRLLYLLVRDYLPQSGIFTTGDTWIGSGASGMGIELTVLYLEYYPDGHFES